jgi:cytolysin-activating lysine-acyltransferase
MTTRALFDQDAENAEYARQLGTAALLMLQCQRYPYFPIASLAAWIQPAILLKQIKFFFDFKGRPIGYMTWAFLAPDVEEKWISDPRVLLHFSEWNEGDRLWIMDFVAPSGFARTIARYAEHNMFPGHDEARSLRRRPDGSVRSVSVWRRRKAAGAPAGAGADAGA